MLYEVITAGKSTMMRLITGYLTPSAGVVKVNNMDVSLYGKEVRRNIGYLPEHNPLYLDMYVKEYLTMVGGIYQLPKVAASVAKMVELTGLGNEQHKKIEALSKGYRQRVGLAQALIHNPSVLILDEPTTGLDPNQIIEVRNLIKTIGREKTVLLSTHIMQEVEAVCERVLIINNGVLVTDQKSDNLAFSKVNTELVVDVEFNNSININLLNQLEGVIKTENVANNQYRIFSTTNQDIRPELFHLAVKENLVILSLSQQKQGLEDFRITSYNVCYTKLLRPDEPQVSQAVLSPVFVRVIISVVTFVVNFALASFCLISIVHLSINSSNKFQI